MRKRSVRATRYTRKSFFVDEQAVRRARRLLGVGTSAQAVRLAIDRIVEMEELRRFMTKTRGRLPPGSFEEP